jgi:RNA polymerase sigma factor (sigma-70 family)
VNPSEAEDFFLTNLHLIDRAIGYVCRRFRLGADEGEEFAAYAKFKLIEDRYAKVRKFEGRSAFSTYITAVIQRLFLQHRVQMWGKWRPSAEARRLGEKGIVVEQLLTRDGFTYAEVVAILTSGSHAALSRAEVEAINVRLPIRKPRATMVSSPGTFEDEPFVEQDHSRAGRVEWARRTSATLGATVAAMTAQDRQILEMRFWAGRRVPDIARELGLDAKKLYKRIGRLLYRLKVALEQAGIVAADAGELLQHSDHDLSFAFPEVRDDEFESAAG